MSHIDFRIANKILSDKNVLLIAQNIVGEGNEIDEKLLRSIANICRSYIQYVDFSEVSHVVYGSDDPTLEDIVDIELTLKPQSFGKIPLDSLDDVTIFSDVFTSIRSHIASKIRENILLHIEANDE